MVFEERCEITRLMTKSSTDIQKCKCYWYKTKDNVTHLIQCNKCGKNSFQTKRCFCECHALENFGYDKKITSCEHCISPSEATEDWKEELTKFDFTDRIDIAEWTELVNFISQQIAKAKEEVWKLIEEYPIAQITHKDGSKTQAVLVHSLKQAKEISLSPKNRGREE